MLGIKHPDTLLSMCNLGVTLSSLNKLDDALKIRTQIVDLRKEVLGIKHPDTLKSMHNLGKTLN